MFSRTRLQSLMHFFTLFVGFFSGHLFDEASWIDQLVDRIDISGVEIVFVSLRRDKNISDPFLRVSNKSAGEVLFRSRLRNGEKQFVGRIIDQDELRRISIGSERLDDRLSIELFSRRQSDDFGRRMLRSEKLLPSNSMQRQSFFHHRASTSLRSRIRKNLHNSISVESRTG